MTRATLLALSAAALWGSPTLAQAPAPPPTPVPVIPPSATTPTIPVPPPPPPPPMWAPGDAAGPAPVFPPVAVVPVPMPAAPATLDAPGFFAGLEVDVVGPRIQRNLSGVVTIAGIPSTVSLPTADLNWTGSPKVEIGYRLADNLGILSASYRSVVTHGTDTLGAFDPLGGADLRTRLNANIIDLDYQSPHYCLAPLWELDWRAGVRIAAIYFDTRAAGFVLEERTSNNFVGAGPHLGAEVTRALGEIPGVALFGGLDGAIVFAGTDQNYEQIILLPDGTRVGGANRTTAGTTAPVLTFRTGISYTPPIGALRWSRFSFGYQFEQWWNVGRSQGDLNIQGLFFRAEFKF
jgi:hypothetical protein